ncbi:TIGR04388 family protein [Leptospira andrefontaineae]|uniref:TIGR04388 family protein n=1 Tax=Leptospira andrefontaineae TaxID=2484976 RepID=A0A4R9H6X1_9LEPT|nr:TIGR04388 family protein [Leptospira andrefontaineae]TGK41267.1 TIGR04388 family protein [Leptospira andrefontaineae]
MSQLRNQITNKIRISLFLFYLIFLPQLSILESQAIEPTELDLSSYQADSWNTLFETAWSLSDINSWNDYINGQYSSFKADWEAQADLQFSNILSQVTQTDGVVGNAAYIDYVSKYLELQRQEAEKNWETQAESNIQQERTFFLTSLQGRQINNLGENLPSETRSQIEQQVQNWNKQFNDTLQIGLYEYQTALQSLQTMFQGMQNSITQTDSEFQANLQQIQQYETQVRDSIKNSNDGLKQYLLNQSLLQLTDNNGVSLLGDFSSLSGTQLLAAYNNIDSSKLNAAGLKLKNLIDTIDSGLDPTNPGSLSDIAVAMQNYLSEEQINATTTAAGYRANEYQAWSYGDISSAIHQITFITSNDFTSDPNHPGGSWNDELAAAIKLYIDSNGSNASDLLGMLSARLGNSNLTVSSINSIDLVAISNSAFLSNYTNWTSDWNTPLLGVGGSYANNGSSFWTLTAHWWACWGNVCLEQYTPYAEQNVYLDASLTIHDSAAQANAIQYESFRDELAGKFSLWTNTLVPAIQNWEQQVSDYKAKYTEWQTTKLSLEQQLQSEYNSQLSQLQVNQNNWATQLSDMYTDANAYSNANSIVMPTLNTNVTGSSLSSINSQIQSFSNYANTNPNLQNLSNFYNATGQLVNAAYNLSMVEGNQILALDNQKAALDSLIQNLQNQKEMNSDISEESYAKFTGKMFDGSNAVGKIEGAGLCSGSSYQANQSSCDNLYNDDKNFHSKYDEVYIDDKGNIHVKQEVNTTTAVFSGGDMTNYQNYTLGTTQKDFVIGNVGTVQLANSNSLGNLFDSTWMAGKSEALSAYINTSQQNASNNYLNQDFLDSINKNSSSVDEYVALEKKRAQDNAIAQANNASTMVSIAQTIIGGGTGMDWAKQQIKEMTKSAVSTAIGEATGIPADVISAYIDYKADQKAKKQAEGQMVQRMIVMNPYVGMLNYVPGIKDVIKPFNQVASKGLSELTVGISKVGAEVVRGATAILGSNSVSSVLQASGISINPKLLENLDDSILAQGTDLAEYARFKDLQEDLSKGDIQAEYKQSLKDAIYLKIAEAVSPSLNNIDPNALAQLWQEYDRQQAAKAAKKEEQQQMLSTAVAMAAATALQFVPGPGTAAGASILTQVGAFFTSAQGMVVAANAVVQGIIASRHGDMNEVFAGVTNGLLLGATGPTSGLTGSISYTPPGSTGSLGDLIDLGLNGSSASGWGGGIAVGGSKLNGGFSFTPGSGIDLNLGGSFATSGGFYNISYNTTSGNTSGSIGAGQEYGSNFGVNLSTDHNQAPSIFVGFGCDVNGQNCGGGKNGLGSGGSLTLNADGTVDIGVDYLGNQGLTVSYNPNTGTWSDIIVSDTWAKDFTYMNAQNVADASANKLNIEVHEKYAELASDPNILKNSEGLKNLANNMGISIDALGDMIANSKDALNSSDPNQSNGALQLLDSVMQTIHDEAYTLNQPNLDLRDAIENSPKINDVETNSSTGGFFGDLTMQTQIYLNQMAGNAFGEFAYVNENGELVFQSCFIEGTLVNTLNGLQPIEKVRIGDKVYSFDEESGQKVIRKVTNTFINPTSTIIRITDSKGGVLETTWNHPFFLEQGLWVKAKDLLVGDQFITFDGNELKVASISEEIRSETVYNLEVEDSHTYFVGKHGILVHNASYDQKVSNSVTDFMLKAFGGEKFESEVQYINLLKGNLSALEEQISQAKKQGNSSLVKALTGLKDTLSQNIDKLVSSVPQLGNISEIKRLESILESLQGQIDRAKESKDKLLTNQLESMKKNLVSQLDSLFSTVKRSFLDQAYKSLKDGLYTGVFEQFNQKPVDVKNGVTLPSDSTIKAYTSDIISESAKIGAMNYLLAGDEKILSMSAAERKAYFDRTLKGFNIDPNAPFEQRKAQLQELVDPKYGAQSGHKGTAVQLTVIMALLQEDPSKYTYLQKDGATDANFKNFQEVKEWILNNSGKRMESEGDAIAAATCRIYANWLQATADGKTSTSFAEWFIFKARTGDIAMGSSGPVMDQGGTPGFTSYFGMENILSNDFGILQSKDGANIVGLSNPIPNETLLKKLDVFPAGKVIQVWDDASGAPGPNHYCLWMKNENGDWINLNHTGASSGGAKVNEKITFDENTKVYKIFY